MADAPLATLPTHRLIYTPLPPTTIRVVELQPATSETQGLRCRLVVQQIQDDHYEALSYVWGKAAIHRSFIYCEDDTDETRNGMLGIGANLAQALTAFRRDDKSRRIWADAICINQEDLAERQAQVRMMGDIFRSAQHVLCWLGGFATPEDDEPKARLAFDFLRQFNHSPRVHLRTIDDCIHGLHVPDTHAVLESWRAIKFLFDVEYFHRAWIIQEVGLAQHARLFWGRKSIWLDWHEAAVFCKFMDGNGASVINFFDSKSWVCNHINLVWETRPDGQPTYDFSEVLHWARIHLSTDPRDYVYALLGHPSATIKGELIVQPDYTVSTAVAYTNLAKNVIQRTNSIHILAFVDHGADFEHSELPTWVPDWHAPNLVAPLRSPTQAAPKVTQDISIIQDGYQTILRCCGYRVGTIYAVSDMIDPKQLTVTTLEAEMKKKTPFLVDHIWKALGLGLSRPATPYHYFIESLGSVLTGAFRTDIAANDGPLSVQQKADCAAYFVKFEKIRPNVQNEGFVASLTAAERSKFEELASTGSANQFIQDMTWTSMCRKVFRTADGCVGLGPRILQPGDICAVLHGSIYPLALRRSGDNYQLVGPILLHGFMACEAYRLNENGKLYKQTFSIV